MACKKAPHSGYVVAVGAAAMSAGIETASFTIIDSCSTECRYPGSAFVGLVSADYHHTDPANVYFWASGAQSYGRWSRKQNPLAAIKWSKGDVLQLRLDIQSASLRASKNGVVVGTMVLPKSRPVASLRWAVLANNGVVIKME